MPKIKQTRRGRPRTECRGEFGEMIDAFIRRVNISDQDFAELVGCDRKTVYRWRTGRSVPSAITMRLLAERLKSVKKVTASGGEGGICLSG